MPRTTKKQPKRAIVLGDTALSQLAPTETVAIADGFAVSVNGLEIDGRPPFEAWAEAGRVLRIAERSAPFALGDFLLQVEAALGERASQIVDYGDGWSEATCANYRWIASRIPPVARRMDRLGIRHHQLVAALPIAKQREWLAKAANEDGEPWTVNRLKKALERGEDLPVSGWYVLVKTAGERAQAQLVVELEAKGYECKPVQRRKQRRETTAA